MVKRQRIAKKPSTPPPGADDWVKQGGIDPEIEAPEEGESETNQQGGDRPTKTGKTAVTFPHRISFDTDTPQYKRLKRAAFEEERSMNEVIREAVEQWLKAHNY